MTNEPCRDAAKIGSFKALAAAGLALCAAGASAADACLSRPIKWVMPFPPGGAMGAMPRTTFRAEIEEGRLCRVRLVTARDVGRYAIARLACRRVLPAMEAVYKIALQNFVAWA
jgi:hypothetical protein